MNNSYYLTILKTRQCFFRFRCLSTLFFPCQPLFSFQNLVNKLFKNNNKSLFLIRCLSTLFFPCQPLFSQDLDFFARLCLWEDPGNHFDDDGSHDDYLASFGMLCLSNDPGWFAWNIVLHLLNLTFLFCEFALRCTSYVPYPLVATFHITPLEKSLSPNWLCD